MRSVSSAMCAVYVSSWTEALHLIDLFHLIVMDGVVVMWLTRARLKAGYWMSIWPMHEKVTVPFCINRSKKNTELDPTAIETHLSPRVITQICVKIQKLSKLLHGATQIVIAGSGVEANKYARGNI